MRASAACTASLFWRSRRPTSSTWQPESGMTLPVTVLPFSCRNLVISSTSTSPPVWHSVAQSPQPTMKMLSSSFIIARISSGVFFSVAVMFVLQVLQGGAQGPGHGHRP